jgi:hypothetical protein
MPSTTHWKLRRLAPRAKRIQARRASELPVIAAYGDTLPRKADAYVTAYDRAAKYKAAWQKEMQEGRSAIGALLKIIRQWLPLLARDIPGFDSMSFGDNPTVPEDVIKDGEQLAGIVEDYKDGNDKPLSYQSVLIGILGPALASADKEWAEAEGADRHYQELLEQVRGTVAEWDGELQSFRRSLAAVTGRSDKDFQKLRVEKAAQQDDEDDVDPDAPPPSLPVPPAAADAPLPFSGK